MGLLDLGLFSLFLVFPFVFFASLFCLTFFFSFFCRAPEVEVSLGGWG